MQQEEKTSLFEKAIDPMLQAAIVGGLFLVFTFAGKILHGGGIMTVGENYPWLCAATFLLFYSIFNSLLSLASPSFNAYFMRAVTAFSALALGSGLVAWALTGASIGQAASYRWIFVVFTIGYFVFLSMMGFMRRVVEFAQQEEWNQPRIRDRHKNARNKPGGEDEKRLF